MGRRWAAAFMLGVALALAPAPLPTAPFWSTQTPPAPLFSAPVAHAASTFNTTLTMPGNSLGLVGHWTFDGKDMIKNVSDTSGQGNNGHLVGYTSTTTRAGPIGQALSFGASQYVDVPHSSSLADLGPMSVSMWVSPQVGNSTTDVLIDKYHGTGVYRWWISYDAKYTGTVKFTYQYGSANLVVTTSNNALPLADQKWHLITVSWDGSQTAANAHIYVDGRETGYQTQTNGSGSHTDDSLDDVHVNQSATAYFDDVRIYNRALSAGEVAQLYREGESSHITNASSCGNDTVTGLDSLAYQTVLGEDGKCWFASNLGTTHVATSYDDYQAYGSLYQWGRLADGHQMITWTSATAGTPVNGTTGTLSSTDNPGTALFILAPSSPYDWRSPQNNNLWGGANRTNNVCPAGWHVPSQAEWSAWMTDAGVASCSASCLQAMYNTRLKLTAAGARNYGTGALIYQGSLGFYWSSSYSGTLASDLFFSGSGVNPADAGNRAFGFSLRCVQDTGTSNNNTSNNKTTINTTLTPPNLAGGLVGHWTFDGKDMINNVADTSGSGNTGYLVGYTSTTTVPGVLGQALVFNGSSNNIAISSSISSVHSVSFWTKPASLTQSVIDLNGTQTVDIVGGTVRGNSFISPTIYIDGAQTTTFPSDSQWHLVTITTGSAISASTLVFGKIASAYYSGSLDDVRVYDRALSAAEVLQLYKLRR